MKGFILFFLFLTACGPKGEQKYTLYKGDQKQFAKIINTKNIPGNPNLNNDLFLANYDYPIELSLYQNESFYYNLPNLGDGTGTWKYDNQHIMLFAKRKLFNMKLEIYGGDTDLKEFIVTFSDRFGPKAYKLEIINKDPANH